MTVSLLSRRLHVLRNFSSKPSSSSHPINPYSPVKKTRIGIAEPINKAFRNSSQMKASTSQCSSIQPQPFDYFLVLDFEATCDQDVKFEPCQEIIEFPVVQLCGRTFQEISRFHTYVRPIERPQLTSFCTQLTGIIQEMLDNQPTLPEALEQFDGWMKEQNITRSKFAFVTCGDWDLQLMLPTEAEYKGIELPDYFSQWINVKKSFCDHKGYFAQGLKHLLKELQLRHTGRLHSGIDDVANIAAITRAIANQGYVYRINGGRGVERKFGNLKK